MDRAVFKAALKQMDFTEYRMASGSTFRAGDIYFDIADEAVLAFITGGFTGDDHLHVLDTFMTATSRLANRFLRAAHRLLPKVFRDLGAGKRRLRA
ncbi:MAG: hypothetical protein ABI587_17905 [Gemmatimonadales bacterium]